MTTFTVETVEPQIAAAISAEVPMDQIRDVFDRGYPAVMEAVQQQDLEPTGPPFGFYPRMPTDTIAVTVGFPVSGRLVAAGDVEPFELPGGRVITGTHVGSYETLAQTYQQLTEWAAAEGHVLGGSMWEIYLTDPIAEPDPNTWRTQLVWPLA